MQGKENLEFDKVYIEKQWSHMESLLDERLPQAKKSNQKPLILILSLLLLLTTLSTAYYAYKFNTSIPVTELIKEKVIYKNIYIETPAVEPLSKKSSSKIQVQTQASAYKFNPNNTNRVASSVQNTSTVSRNTPTQKATSFQATESSAATKEIKSSGLNNFNTLPSIDSEINTTEFVESGLYFDNSSLILNKDKTRKTEFQVGVLLASTMNWDYTGMGIETGVRFPIGKKLGFNTGIAISYLDRDHLFIPDFIRGSNGTLTDPKNPQTYYEGLKKLKQVYVPLSLSYDITDSWAISSGFKFRYTYKEIVNEDLPLPAARPSRIPVENHESIFNNANLGLTAGLRYSINPSFSILLDTEWGMSSLINRSDFTTFQSKYDLNIINLITAYNF